MCSTRGRRLDRKAWGVARPKESARTVNGLVNDRELRHAEDDEFGHRAIVAELMDLVLCVPTPSNIALYGRWGSGKTSLSNMLEQRIMEEAPHVAYTRFDSFKWAETPLHRHFLGQVAKGLQVDFDVKTLYH